MGTHEHVIFLHSWEIIDLKRLPSCWCWVHLQDTWRVFIQKQWSQETTHFGLRFDISKNWKNYSPETNIWNLKMPPTPPPPKKKGTHTSLGGETSNIFYVHPGNWGRWTPFDYSNIFQKGVESNHQPDIYSKHQFFWELPTRKLLRFRSWNDASMSRMPVTFLMKWRCA